MANAYVGQMQSNLENYINNIGDQQQVSISDMKNENAQTAQSLSDSASSAYQNYIKNNSKQTQTQNANAYGSYLNEVGTYNQTSKQIADSIDLQSIQAKNNQIANLLGTKANAISADLDIALSELASSSGSSSGSSGTYVYQTDTNSNQNDSTSNSYNYTDDDNTLTSWEKIKEWIANQVAPKSLSAISGKSKTDYIQTKIDNYLNEFASKYSGDTSKKADDAMDYYYSLVERNATKSQLDTMAAKMAAIQNGE